MKLGSASSFRGVALGAWAALFAFGCSNPPAQPDAATDASGSDIANESSVVDASDGGSDVADATLDAPSDAGRPPWLEPWSPGPRARPPAGFLWGSATAGYQIEGQLSNTDWSIWEQMGRVTNNDRADDGPQSYTRWMEDVRALRETGQNSYRFGVEWARLFPTRASWEQCRNATGDNAAKIATCRAAASAEGKQYYHQLIDALRSSTPRIVPMVTVHHWVMPDYIADPRMDFRSQGWMNARMRTDMALYAGVVAAEYGDKVDWYVTINEPLVLVLAGYLDGRFPPGRQLEIDGAINVIGNLVYAHAGMYDAIKANDRTVAEMTGGPITPAQASYVSIAHHIRRIYPANAASAADMRAATRADWLNHGLFFDAIVRGNFDANGDGTIGAGEPSNDPALRGRADYLGINYYGMTAIRSIPAIPVVGGLPVPEEQDRGLPKTDFGWDILPRGFEDILVRFGNEYRLPILVTENGIADSADANRPRFLYEHIAAMLSARQRGANILGYYHWSTIDNFEWVGGYCPHFGLYSVDFNNPMRPRTGRPSAMIYRDIIRSGEVTDAQLAMVAPYRNPTRFCPGTVTLAPDAGR
ncbi:MAG: glycoside hydrolase family 1 protein [Myxococcales bacterium]|nr:glycoside hydrolase family 1 protein [Myxococcales bacterium]